MSIEICFATNNPNKLKELRDLVPKGIKVLSLKDIGCHDDLPETHETLEENSLEKAQYVFDNYHVDCFADDTGLEVEALNGAPGVYSARYAGTQANAKNNTLLLLNNLENEKNRKAQFRTVISLIIRDKKYLFEGIVQGTIAKTPSGDHGFGYDPIFIPEGMSGTFAEMNAKEKNSISHRGKATEKLVEFLKTV